MLDTLCPDCSSACALRGTCERRGDVYECSTCKMPPNSDDPLLWFWESDRMWEDLDDHEPMSKPTMVKVILAVPLSQIRFN